jgi:hypothetical protein
MKTLRFTGRRIEVSESAVYKGTVNSLRSLPKVVVY